MQTRKLTSAALLIAIGTLSAHLIYIPAGVSKCFPVQHAINVMGAVLLGPDYAVAIGFIIACLRNMLGTGSLLAFPGKDDEKYIQPMADIFKVLSDPTRIRILSLLAHEEMCVTCIADSLGMTHSAISHQLRLLRATNLVKFTKDGKEVIYSLDDSHVLSLFDQALDHVKHKVL